MATPRPAARPTRGASIQPRPRADGTTAYRLTYRLDGAQRVETFDDPELAELWRVRFARDPRTALAALKATIAAESGQDVVLTVDRMVLDHIDGLSGLAERTLADYRRDHRNHIRPHLGDLPAQALSDRKVTAAWVRTLAAEPRPLSAKSIANVHALLSAACSTAVDAGALPTNPVRGLTLPRDVPQEMVFLTQGQAADLLEVLSERWRPLVITLLGSGIRYGEAAALLVGDADLVNGTLRITKSIGRSETNQPYVKATKTRRGVRTVRIDDVVVDALRPLVAGRKADQPLFASRTGSAIRHSNFHTRVWKPAIARLHKKPYEWQVTPRPHDLRHTYASWALAAGVPLIELQRQMGHESIVTTADRYGHLEPGTGTRTATAVGQVLSAAALGSRHIRGVKGGKGGEPDAEAVG